MKVFKQENMAVISKTDAAYFYNFDKGEWKFGWATEIGDYYSRTRHIKEEMEECDIEESAKILLSVMDE